MKVEYLLEELETHNAVVLFFFYKEMNEKMARTLAKTDIWKLKKNIQNKIVQTSAEDKFLYIGTRRILINDIKTVIRDKHNLHIIYIMGRTFTTALYTIKR